MAREELREHKMRAMTRGLEVLRHLNVVGQETGPNVAASLGISRATVGRILSTLEGCGLVRQDKATGIFCLASGVCGVSRGPTEEGRVLWIAAPILYDLQQELLWPTCLATHENGKIVIQESTHAVSPFSVDTRMVGSRHPVLEGSLGRAYVAFSRNEERQEYLLTSGARNSKGSDFSARIERLVQDIRKKGYAYRQQGAYPKTSSIAVPVRYRDRVVASMNVVWIASAMKFDEAVWRFYPALSRAQERIERELAVDPISARAHHAGSLARLAS